MHSYLYNLKIKGKLFKKIGCVPIFYTEKEGFLKIFSYYDISISIKTIV